MRGKACQKLILQRRVRITPACAGKRGRCARRCRCRRDHPRVCGEKPWTPWEKIVLKGSPPRVRGKALVLTDFMADSRITPACAGKSASTSSTRTLSEDHPRVCGEKWKFGRRVVQHPEDHPRVCGEKTLRLTVAYRLLGSPPRVRGKVLFATVSCFSPRITPACAGKRSPSPIHSEEGQDHPRVCGEKFVLLFDRLPCVGSPPRVRGKAHDLSASLRQRGITPACAGKRQN